MVYFANFGPDDPRHDWFDRPTAFLQVT